MYRTEIIQGVNVMAKIYVASSWRNQHQNSVVRACRALGYDVYDFKNPPNKSGFGWEQLDGNHKSWTPEQYIQLLSHDIANQGYKADIDALDECDICVLLLPCGRSAHLEAGYAIGQGKRTLIFISNEKFEPELMYKAADLITHKIEDIYQWLELYLKNKATP